MGTGSLVVSSSRSFGQGYCESLPRSRFLAVLLTSALTVPLLFKRLPLSSGKSERVVPKGRGAVLFLSAASEDGTDLRHLAELALGSTSRSSCFPRSTPFVPLPPNLSRSLTPLQTAHLPRHRLLLPPPPPSLLRPLRLSPCPRLRPSTSSQSHLAQHHHFSRRRFLGLAHAPRHVRSARSGRPRRWLERTSTSFDDQ